MNQRDSIVSLLMELTFQSREMDAKQREKSGGDKRYGNEGRGRSRKELSRDPNKEE